MTDSDWHNLAVLLCYWIAYFALHSILASLWAKRRITFRFPSLIPPYRLIYNGISTLLLLPIIWHLYLHPGPMLWRWQGVAALLANGLAVLAILGFIRSLRYYDTDEFMGLRQLHAGRQNVEDQEHFTISPFHRFVRHPWYFFGLVIIWTRDMQAATLLSGIMMTLYLIIGSRLEEQKLLVYHGEIYRRYMQRVPGLFPCPWKFLSTDASRELLERTQPQNEPLP